MSEHNRMVAGGMIALAELLKVMIDDTHEDDDVSFLVDTRDWLLDRSCVFSPPGEPEGGYPKEGAKIFNIEAERARRRNG